MSYDSEGPMNFFQLITTNRTMSDEEREILASFDEFHLKIIEALKKSEFIRKSQPTKVEKSKKKELQQATNKAKK